MTVTSGRGDVFQAQSNDLSARLHYAGLHLGAFLALQLLYSGHVADYAFYDSYPSAFSLSRFLIAAPLAFLLPFAIRPTGKPSELFLHLAMAFTVSPSLALFAGADTSVYFIVLTLAAFAVLVLVSRVSELRIDYALPGIPPGLVVWAALAAVACFIASFALFGGFQYFNLDPTKVYEFRRAAAANLPGIYAYLTPLITKALIPIALVIACARRMYWEAAALFAGCILIAALTGHKAIPLYAIAAVCVWYAYRLPRLPALIAWSVIAAAILATIMLHFGNGTGPIDYIGYQIGQRGLILPSLLNHLYMEAFSTRPFYWWSESRLTLGLIPTPFPVPSPRLIGDLYFTRGDFAGTGWIGSGYAQAGALGVAIYSIGVGVLFAVIDWLAKAKGQRFVVAVMATYAGTVLVDMDFLTTFLTGGLIFALALVAVVEPFSTNVAIKAAAVRKSAWRWEGGMNFGRVAFAFVAVLYAIAMWFVIPWVAKVDNAEWQAELGRCRADGGNVVEHFLGTVCYPRTKPGRWDKWDSKL